MSELLNTNYNTNYHYLNDINKNVSFFAWTFQIVQEGEPLCREISTNQMIKHLNESNKFIGHMTDRKTLKNHNPVCMIIFYLIQITEWQNHRKRWLRKQKNK